MFPRINDRLDCSELGLKAAMRRCGGSLDRLAETDDATGPEPLFDSGAAGDRSQPAAALPQKAWQMTPPSGTNF